PAIPSATIFLRSGLKYAQRLARPFFMRSLPAPEDLQEQHAETRAATEPSPRLTRAPHPRTAPFARDEPRHPHDQPRPGARRPRDARPRHAPAPVVAVEAGGVEPAEVRLAGDAAHRRAVAVVDDRVGREAERQRRQLRPPRPFDVVRLRVLL